LTATNPISAAFALRAEYYLDQGVKYQHRGTSGEGVDCTGLLIAIAKDLGYLADYQLRPYPPDWNLHSGADDYLLDELDKFADRIGKPDAVRGDIAVIYFGRCPAHAGILTAGWPAPQMIHAHSAAGRVRVAMLKGSPWSRRWYRTYRLNEEKLRNAK
jgi:cell wall-associated NlpC family hydrolase